MPGPLDEFEKEFPEHTAPAEGEEHAPGGLDAFAAEYPDAVGDMPEQSAAPAQAHGAPEELPWYERLIMGVGNGASMGHGKQLGALGAKIGDALAGEGLTTGITENSSGLPAERVGSTPEEQGAELADKSNATGVGKLGTGAGAILASVPLAAAAGPGVAAQTALGAAQGAASAHGAGAENPLEYLAAMGTGGALAGGGALLGKGLQAGSKYLNSARPVPAQAPAAQSMLPGFAPEAVSATPSRLEALLGKARGRTNEAWDSLEPVKALYGEAKMLGARVAGQAGKAAPYIRGASQVAANASGIGIGKLAETAHDWAVQSVLSQGSGLPPEDDARLTAAVMSGDKQRVAAENFIAASKSPKYAKNMQKTVASIQVKDQ